MGLFDKFKKKNAEEAKDIKVSMPETEEAVEEVTEEAEVVAVGPGGMVDGKEVAMQVKVGDKVIFSKYAGNEVKLDKEEYIIVRQGDILAIVE